MANFKFIEVNVSEQGFRLDRFLLRYFSSIPYSLLQKKIRLGYFKVNGKKKRPSYKIIFQDKITYIDNIEINKKVKKNKVIEKNKIEILKSSIIFEDKHILILNKPYGIAVQGGTKISFSIDDALPFLSSSTDNLRLTHRIDKNTTGLLLIAKSREIAKNVAKLFKEGNIKKIYWALVLGAPKKITDNINISIAKVSKGGVEKMEIAKDNKNVALTHYKTLETKSGLSLLEVLPKTGKTHQIRIHMLLKKIPILGDKKYKLLDKNEKFANTLYKMHLHSKSIRFNLLNKKYIFDAELPQHFKQTLLEKRFKILKNKNAKGN